MFAPGATTSGFLIQSFVGPLPEKFTRLFPKILILLLSSEDPTVISFRLIPGEVTEPAEGPLFPAAVVTIIPLSHTVSMARTRGSSETVGTAPIEKFAIFMLYFYLLSRSHCIPARTSEEFPFPLPLNIFMETIFASGAIPQYLPSESIPFTAAIPATCVACKNKTHYLKGQRVFIKLYS